MAVRSDRSRSSGRLLRSREASGQGRAAGRAPDAGVTGLGREEERWEARTRRASGIGGTGVRLLDNEADMAIDKCDPLTIDEVRQYVDGRSDFAFELRVLHALVGLGFKCEHGGTYRDPVTGKPRQFDIRATIAVDRLVVKLAVECKNLMPDRPLLVLRVPRTRGEAYHDVLFADELEVATGTVPDLHSHGHVQRKSGWDSIYSPTEPVGKGCAQARRKASERDQSDSEVYDRWSQALQSAQDLADRAVGPGVGRLSAIFPILVVPDETLWVADFGEDGLRKEDPRTATRCAYYVGREYSVADGPTKMSYSISHLEFATIRGLEEFGAWLRSPGCLDDIFSGGRPRDTGTRGHS